MTGQQLFEHRVPGGKWADLPPGIQRAFDIAARERSNPRLCANCGRDADHHSGAHDAACRFAPSTRPSEAVKAANGGKE